MNDAERKRRKTKGRVEKGYVTRRPSGEMGTAQWGGEGEGTHVGRYYGDEGMEINRVCDEGEACEVRKERGYERARKRRQRRTRAHQRTVLLVDDSVDSVLSLCGLLLGVVESLLGLVLGNVGSLARL